MTLPGSAKQQKLSTWPFTTASSPQMPRHSQMIFFRPSAACVTRLAVDHAGPKQGQTIAALPNFNVKETDNLTRSAEEPP